MSWIQLIFLISVIIQQNCGCYANENVNETESSHMVRSRNCTNELNRSDGIHTYGFMRSNHLTYRIISYSKQLNSSIVDDEVIAEAFEFWTNKSGLVIERKLSGEVDIEIGFYSRAHGDTMPFKGQGDVLGHAFFPPNGLVHFDDDEIWVASSGNFSKYGKCLLAVAVHEFGHVLGLLHRMDNNSVMYPRYIHQDYHAILSDGDIYAIQAIYGPPDINETVFKPPYDETLKGCEINREICKISEIDAIFNASKNAYIIISENKVFYFNGNVYPFSEWTRNVSELFPEVQGKIVGALHRSGVCHIFTNYKVWRYTSKGLSTGYPKMINELFVNGPNRIDGITWSQTPNHVYIFQQKKVWLTSFSSPFKPVERRILRLNDTITGAVVHRNKTYLIFGKKEYYRMKESYDVHEIKFLKRDIKKWFLKC